MTLNYFVTPKGLNPIVVFGEVRCPIAPWSRRDAMFIPEVDSFVAAANIYLAEMKIRDDIHDEHHPV